MDGNLAELYANMDRGSDRSSYWQWDNNRALYLSTWRYMFAEDIRRNGWVYHIWIWRMVVWSA